jgi:hypothetical protein
MVLVAYTKYYLQTCLLCPPMCASCTSNEVCQSCVDGTDDCLSNPCFKVEGNCSSCVLQRNNQLACIGCLPSFFLQAGACVACLPACEYCQDGTTCDNCQPGYYLQLDTCKACDQYCLACLPNKICTKCSTGYFLYGTGTCMPCTAECLDCTAVTACTTCGHGFEVQDGICSKVQSGNGAVIGLSVALSLVCIVCLILGYFIFK